MNTPSGGTPPAPHLAHCSSGQRQADEVELEVEIGSGSGEVSQVLGENPSDPFAALHQGGNPMDKSIASTLKNMSEASADMEGMDTASAEQMGEDIMKKMMGEFEKLGEKDDFQDIIDGMICPI